MTSMANANCRAEGAKNIALAGGEDEICKVFIRRLAEVIGDSAAPQRLSIELDVGANGTIEAVVSDSVIVEADDGARTDGSERVVAISVDVMDRELARQDIETLAEAVGEAMNAAPIKGTETK